MKPLAIDLFCGLGGWADGFLAEGYDVIGFDIERHDYGTGGYPGQLVLQDVLTLHGSQFRNAACIVASPPCQAYSYRAMPWKRAKALPPPSNELFDACFRIQREACEAANPRTGQCQAFGSCRRPAITLGHFGRPVCRGCSAYGWGLYGPPTHTTAYRYIPMVVENVRGAERWVGPARARYGSYFIWGDVPALIPIGKPRKQEGDRSWFYDNYENSARRFSSHSKQRKAWSAQIAKIPFELAAHIAMCFRPANCEAVA